MTFVDLKQGSDAWLAWREGGLGASDAPAIMGESPYCTREGLMLERLGLHTRGQNAAMDRGTALEAEALALYAAGLTKAQHVEPVCVQHETMPRLRASLDGLVTECGIGEPDGLWTPSQYGSRRRSLRVVEIKCWSAEKHAAVVAGRVPRGAVAQVQCQLLVTGLPRCDLVSYHGGGIAVVSVKPDAGYQERLLPELERFWLELQQRRKALRKGTVTA